MYLALEESGEVRSSSNAVYLPEQPMQLVLDYLLIMLIHGVQFCSCFRRTKKEGEELILNI
jgi:hypothetical protein